MTVLLVAMGALIAALFVRSILDPWAPSPDTQETEEARAQMMQSIALSSF
ncbi:MAG TPA: hypothetical protein VKI44_09060 [Acetobacteraceae bacterium]|nr:hypothetical protein [Acetobacteraceae bacterium]